MEFNLRNEKLMWLNIEKNDLVEKSIKLVQRSSWLLRASSKTIWYFEGNHEQVRQHLVK